MASKRPFPFRTLLLVIYAGALVSCGGTQAPPLNPAPFASAVSPSSVIAGSAGFTLTVNGAGFIPGSTVRWNGTDRVTTFVRSTQLNAAIPASDIASGGVIQVQVFNPAPSGGTSAPLAVTVSNPLPAVTSVNPSTGMVDAGSFDLRVAGESFVPTSVVQWNGSPRTTSFQSSTLLLANIPSTDLASAGMATVSVVSPTPGGGTSAALSFAINNPPPVVTAISPRTVLAGSGDFTLSIEGRQFVSGTVIRWNGTDLATTKVSSTLVTAAIPARDIAMPSISTVEVANPAPGGGSSGGFDYAVNPPGTGVVERISVASDGTQANGDSWEPSVSSDGRFVAFRSSASNLVPGDTNGADDVFVRDTCMGASPGCIPSTIRVSVASNGTEGDLWSAAPVMSADGRFVAFESPASNLVPGDANGAIDVFLRDTCLGAPAACVPSTLRVSVTNAGAEADFGSTAPTISANGRFVAFQSSATNLVAGDTNFQDDVFLRDTCVGALAGCAPSTIRISPNRGIAPAISPDAEIIAFGVQALGGCCGLVEQVLLSTTCIGAPAGCNPDTTPAAGLDPSLFCPNNACGPPYFGGVSKLSLSPVGSFVAFAAADIEDASGNVTTGGIFFCTPPSGGLCGLAVPSVDFALVQDPAITADGALIVYVADTTASLAEVLARDSSCRAAPGCAPATFLLSVAGDGTPANSVSFSPSLSADGRFVVFASRAANLVTADSNGFVDIFIARTGRP